jgi:hypothetical protein
MDRRLLTPVEAGLLLAPAPGTAAKCLQAGLLSLLDAGRISIEPSTSVFKQTALLLDRSGALTATPLPGHLLALEQALLTYGKGKRLVSTEVLHALQKRFGVGFGRYVHDQVAPGLIKRGLLTRTDSKWLGLIPRVRYDRTARGDALTAPIQRLMSAVEKVPSLINSDPSQAIRIARSAGVLLVMSPEARRQIPALRKLLTERGEESTALAYVPPDNDREQEWEQVLEFGDFALDLDTDALFDGLEAVGDFTSGGDASTSDGGDGGGGD